MQSLQVPVGIALIFLAARVLSPLWWDPLRYKIFLFRFALRRARWELARELPKAVELAKSHWRRVEHERQLFAALAFLTALGSGWLYWLGGPVPSLNSSNPSGLDLMVLAIWAFTLLAGVAAFVTAWMIARRVWEGFWGTTPKPLVVQNPLNRVGVANPLGESRFATAVEVHHALAGGGPVHPRPQFKD